MGRVSDEKAVREVVRMMAAAAVDQGLVDAIVFDRARRFGWSPPVMGMSDDELSSALETLTKAAKERCML